jgi:flagellar biosynthetic protein FliR
MFLLQALEESCDLGLQVSAPILVTMVITNLIMGLISKFVPQINIFVVSFSLTILLGLYLVLFSLPALGRHVEHYFSRMDTSYGRLLPD